MFFGGNNKTDKGGGHTTVITQSTSRLDPIKKSIHIKGKGPANTRLMGPVIIDGGPDTRVVIEDLTIDGQNKDPYSCPAVVVRGGDVTLIHVSAVGVSFECVCCEENKKACKSLNDGEDGYGGAVLVKGGRLRVISSALGMSTALYGGIVAVKSGTFEAYNSVFYAGNALSGGVFYVGKDGSVRIEGCNIVGPQLEGPDDIFDFVDLESCPGTNQYLIHKNIQETGKREHGGLVARVDGRLWLVSSTIFVDEDVLHNHGKKGGKIPLNLFDGSGETILEHLGLNSTKYELGKVKKSMDLESFKRLPEIKPVIEPDELFDRADAFATYINKSVPRTREFEKFVTRGLDGKTISKWPEGIGVIPIKPVSKVIEKRRGEGARKTK